jgi:hypothetical protein
MWTWVPGTQAMGWFGLSYLGVVAAATSMVNGFQPQVSAQPYRVMLGFEDFLGREKVERLLNIMPWGGLIPTSRVFSSSVVSILMYICYNYSSFFFLL